MTRRTSQANKIIQHHVFMAMGAGLIPFAGIDMLAVGRLQLGMLRRLCDLYGKDYEEMQSQAIICSISGSAIARGGASIVKTIPIVGTAIGGISMSITAGASTYALAKMFIRYFESREPIDTSKLKKFFEYYFKKFIASFKKKSKLACNADSLRALIVMLENGDISEQEFQDMKTELLEELKDNKVSMDEAIRFIKELVDIRDEGMLTEEEFQIVKDSVFGNV